MIEVRKACDGDDAAIRELFALCFGRPMSAEEWGWKYRESPWGSMAAVALHDGKVVAHYGGVEMEFSSPGRTFRVFEPCDVMTHPDYRSRFFSRRGAMVQAAELFYQTAPMDFAFGFASERHSILGTKQLGYTKHSYINVLERRIDGLPSGLPLLVEMRQGWDGMTGERIDEFMGSVIKGYSLSIRKDSRYLFWRYRDHPVRKYQIVYVRKRLTKRLKGLIVVRQDEGRLDILDFFFDDRFRMDELLGFFGRAAVHLHAHSLRVWVNEHEPLHGMFLDRGFAASKGVPFSFKIFDQSVTADYLFRNYCYRMGDYDAA